MASSIPPQRQREGSGIVARDSRSSEGWRQLSNIIEIVRRTNTIKMNADDDPPTLIGKSATNDASTTPPMPNVAGRARLPLRWPSTRRVLRRRRSSSLLLPSTVLFLMLSFSSLEKKKMDRWSVVLYPTVSRTERNKTTPLRRTIGLNPHISLLET